MIANSSALVRSLAVLVLLLVAETAFCAEQSKGVRLATMDPASIPAEIRLPDTPPMYAVQEVQDPPTIDGKLDDPAWQHAPVMGRFFLDNGQGAMQYETITRMVRDKTYLYVAVECLHPNISEVKVVKGARDRVAYQGETVELFLHTDRSIRDYVQIIYDMSGAFTDQRVYNPGEEGRTSDTKPLDFEWNGDIIAATDVGGAGWRLETRIKIADLAVGGGIDPHVWGANVARSSKNQSGSWARIVGRYQQPEAFGLLTMSAPPLAVESISMGVLAQPSPGEKTSTVRLRLRNLRSDGASPATVHLTAGEPKDHQPTAVTQKITLGAGEAQDVLCRVDLADAETLNVSIEGQGPKALFTAQLPIRRAKARPDTMSSQRFTCAVRPARPVAFAAEDAKLYLLAWAAPGQSAGASGRLLLTSSWSGKEILNIPVAVDLPAGGFGGATVALPAEQMKDGQYDIHWIPDSGDTSRCVTSVIEYAQLDLPSLRAMLTPPDVAEVLGKMNCPVPADPRDRALTAVRIERLARRLAEPTPDSAAASLEDVLFSLRQLRELVQAFREQGYYVQGRRGWFETALYSTSDSSAQPYSLYVPGDYDKDPDRKWPLLVFLHGGGGTHGGDKGYIGSPDITEYITLLPLGRGPHVGYGRLSALDIIQAIQEACAQYRVDPDAVFLFGGSMGGYGTFEIASHWPDLFAACKPICGGGEWWPLEQMCNLPTVIHHGLQDLSVASSHSRFVAARMYAAGCPVQVYLHPDFGHRVTPMSDKISPWEKFRSIRRDSQPRSVVVDSDIAGLRKAYWLSIPRPIDVQQDAYLRATFVSQNHLALTARNVDWAKISLPLKWVDPKEPMQISVDAGDRWAEVTTGDAKALYIHWDGDKLAATTQPAAHIEDPTAYTGGGAHNLFWLGRPVRVVYGTAGSPEQTEQLAKLAQSIRKYYSADDGDYDVGGYPILKDTDVTAEVLRTCDLILLGDSQENAVVARMAGKLPVKLVDGQYVVASTPPMQYAHESIAFSLFYNSPLQPDRRIWWFAGVKDHDAFVKIAKMTDDPGCFGRHAPELIIVDRSSNKLLATAQLDAKWQLTRPWPLRPVRDIWPARPDMDRDLSEFFRGMYSVDISLIGVVPPGETVQWDSLTAGEAMLFAQKCMMVITEMTGEDLRKWLPLRADQFREWGRKEYVQPWAGPAPDSLDPKKTYRVLMGTDEASSCEKRTIHPRYLRFFQESDFEAAISRFILEKGLNADVPTPVALHPATP